MISRLPSPAFRKKAKARADAVIRFSSHCLPFSCAASNMSGTSAAPCIQALEESRVFASSLLARVMLLVMAASQRPDIPWAVQGGNDEKDRSHYQALQVRRGEGSTQSGGGARDDRDRNPRLRPTSGAHRGLSRRRGHRGIPPQGQNRNPAQR